MAIEQFDFFQALHQLLDNKKTPHDLPTKRLMIKPNASLRFPTRDIDRIEEDDELITVFCQFMGLYGVDSPLPMYLNQACLNNNETGALFRAFLDIFNHRLYLLYFMAWRAFQPQLGGEAQKQYKSLVDSLHYGPQKEAASYCFNQVSFASLVLTLKHFFSNAEIKIKRPTASWEGINSKWHLGLNGELGDNTLLGEHIWCFGRRVDIEIGPMTECHALFYLQQQKITSDLNHKLQVLFGKGIQLHLFFLVSLKNHSLKLGMDSCLLGLQSRLGKPAQEFQRIKLNTSI